MERMHAGVRGGLICVSQIRLPLLSCWQSSSYLLSFTCCSNCTFCKLSLLSERPGGAVAGDAAVTAIFTTHCMSIFRRILRRISDLTRSKLRSSFDSSPTSCKSSNCVTKCAILCKSHTENGHSKWLICYHQKSIKLFINIFRQIWMYG